MANDKDIGTWMCLFGYIGIFVGSIFAAVPILGYQVYFYLRSGEWLPISVIDCLKYLISQWMAFFGAPKGATPEQIYAIKPYIWSWLWYPQDWIGIHELLQSTPLSLFLVLLITSISAICGLVYALKD